MIRVYSCGSAKGYVSLCAAKVNYKEWWALCSAGSCLVSAWFAAASVCSGYLFGVQLRVL